MNIRFIPAHHRLLSIITVLVLAVLAQAGATQESDTASFSVTDEVEVAATPSDMADALLRAAKAKGVKPE